MGSALYSREQRWVKTVNRKSICNAWRARLNWGLAACVFGLLAAPLAYADFELADAQGRRIVLKDDGTWRFADGKPASASAGAASAAASKDARLAQLELTRRIDAPGNCSFEFTLTNALPYEIRNIVPDFTVLRANGVEYLTQNVGFELIRPGDLRRRQLRFDGISCAEIATLKVSGGDRCEMNDLNRFSEGKGDCLARVRVLPSQLLKFEK